MLYLSLSQDVALEAAIPRSAICRMWDGSVQENEYALSDLENGREYREGGAWAFTSGSRAEGLALEDDWGHEAPDVDVMYLNGGPFGVYMAGGQQPKGKSCLDFRPQGCPPAYCKLEISDLDGLKKSRAFGERWFGDRCVEESGGKKWINTYNLVRCMKDNNNATRDESVSGPASQDQDGEYDTVQTLVSSGPLPDLNYEYRHRTRGPWPHVSLINCLLQLPMLLVLVGHKLSPEFHLQARLSMSHLEYKLIKELRESVRQGYIACKYVMKRFLKARRGHKVSAGGGRSRVCSYHIKTALLHFLEKRPPSLYSSPFKLFLDLLAHLDVCLQEGKLSHYFLVQCNLLETVGDDERHLAHQVIREILSNPLNALLTSPTRPEQIYGEVRPDDLVIAFQRVSAHPTCEQSRNDLSKLLARVDERRRERFREQRESDGDYALSCRTELTGLVEMLKHWIKHFMFLFDRFQSHRQLF